ncbi:helix-turn-helix domain-containing protein [Saccharicrinis aurantiacus]|uniref:helix-turn-helix domain-containing protein n=1 Tax=Saccharicrinis aurantiacus TaxID=1849719 RepID=UPI0024912C87|nr:AraC family transcriptional regulator [Saccharicrinis aurantiacus]
MKGTRIFKILFTLLVIGILVTHWSVKSKSQDHFKDTRVHTFTRYIEDDIYELVRIIKSKKLLLASIGDGHLYSSDDIVSCNADFKHVISVLLKNNEHISSIKLYCDNNKQTTFYKKNDKVYTATEAIDYAAQRTLHLQNFGSKHRAMISKGESALLWDKPHINSFDKYLNFNAWYFKDHYHMVVKSDISSINSAYLFNSKNDYYRFLVDSAGNPISKHKLGFNTGGLNRSLIPIKMLPTDTFKLDSGIEKPTFKNTYKTIHRKEGDYAIKLVKLNKSNLDSLYLLFMIPYDHLEMHSSYARVLGILEWILPLLLLLITVFYFVTHKTIRNNRVTKVLEKGASSLLKTFNSNKASGGMLNAASGNINEATFSHTKQKVYAMIADKLYLQNQLSLEKCAAELKIDKQILSQFIQFTYNCSYRNFINELRIKEALKIMQRNPDFVDKYSFEHLGEMVGFNSRTSFYRAFKHHAGCAPTEYFKNETELT